MKLTYEDKVQIYELRKEEMIDKILLNTVLKIKFLS